MNIKNVYDQGFAKKGIIKNNCRLSKVLELLQHNIDIPEGSLLDVGCGDGVFAKLISAATGSPKMYGIDISEMAVKEAVNNGVTAYCADPDEEKLPFEDNSFDLIYCGSLIEVVLNADQLILELKRLLKKDGVIILTNPNMGAWASRIALLLGRFPFYYRASTQFEFGKLFARTLPGNSTGFIRLFTTHAMREFLSAHNLEVKSVWGAGENELPRPLRSVDKIFSGFPSLAFQNIWMIKLPG